MNAWAELIVSYALNACWQVPVVVLAAGAAVRALSGAPARLCHAIWLLAAALSALLPAGGVWGLFASASQAVQVPETASLSLFEERLVLVLFAVPALWRGGRMLAAAVAAWRWRKKAGPFPAAVIGPLLRSRDVAFLVSPPELEAAGPLLVGLLRPAILLPRFLAASENRLLLEAAIAHELAHLRRKDMLVYVVFEIALAPLAFHPVTLWLRRKLTESRELACDEQVARESLSPVVYARRLLEVARNVVGRTAAIQALGVGEGGILERRIRALLEMPRRATRSPNPWQRVTCILAAGMVCVFLARAAGNLYLWIAEPHGPLPALVPPPPPPPPPPSSRAL
ncbi:MAG: M56 family metallopeptidase [Bryobacteraceae bacterium]